MLKILKIGNNIDLPLQWQEKVLVNFFSNEMLFFIRYQIPFLQYQSFAEEFLYSNNSMVLEHVVGGQNHPNNGFPLHRIRGRSQFPKYSQ